MAAWTILAVRPLPHPRLEVALSNGKTLHVDVAAYLDSPGYRPLSEPDVFSRVAVEEWGHGVEWLDIDIGIDADTLYRLDREQSGQAMPVEEFNAWMSRNGLLFCHPSSNYALLNIPVMCSTKSKGLVWIVLRRTISLTEAAQALGLSRKTIGYYHGGHKPIPTYIGLACRGWEVIQTENRAA